MISNLTEYAESVLVQLREGVGGVELPYIFVSKADRGNNPKHYVTLNNVYYDYEPSANEYIEFESWKFRNDYEKKVIELFPDCVIKFCWTAQEIEIYRTGYNKP